MTKESDLNNILMEGTTHDITETGFVLRSVTIDRATGSEAVLAVEIRPESEKLAANCFEYLKEGRGVRIVGRLCRDGVHYIQADHVEFKSKEAI